MSVREPITAAVGADLTGDDLAEAIVGTRRGSVVVTGAGEIIGRVGGAQATVADVCVVDRGEPQIVLVRADGAVQRLRLVR